MNYRTIILAFLVCTLTCNAQLPSCSQILTKGNVVDTARFVITYDMRFTSIENDTLHSDDRKVLVGDRMSVDYSQTTYYYDSIGTDMYVHGAENVPMCQDFVFPMRSSTITPTRPIVSITGCSWIRNPKI